MAKPLATQVLWSLGRAGAERMVLGLAQALPSHGFDARVVAAGGGGDMASAFADAGVDVRIFPAGLNRLSLLSFLRIEIRKHPPAVWHTHLADVWGGLAARSSGLHPWIITAHNVDRLSWVQHAARGWAFRHADHVACITDAVRDYVAGYGVPADRLSVIRHGIDLAAFPFRGPHRFSDVPRFLSVGRLAPQKDHATLIRALAMIKRPWRLDLIGDGPERGRLKELAASLGVMPRVRFIGTVADVRPHYREADVLCFPSRWEGQGLVLLEAAACGVPIIASDLPVFRETFDDDSLVFVPAGDVMAWARAIERQWSDERTSAEMARHASRIVHGQFSVDRMAGEYAALYRRLMR